MVSPFLNADMLAYLKPLHNLPIATSDVKSKLLATYKNIIATVSDKSTVTFFVVEPETPYAFKE